MDATRLVFLYVNKYCQGKSATYTAHSADYKAQYASFTPITETMKESLRGYLTSLAVMPPFELAPTTIDLCYYERVQNLYMLPGAVAITDYQHNIGILPPDEEHASTLDVYLAGKDADATAQHSKDLRRALPFFHQLTCTTGLASATMLHEWLATYRQLDWAWNAGSTFAHMPNSQRVLEKMRKHGGAPNYLLE